MLNRSAPDIASLMCGLVTKAGNLIVVTFSVFQKHCDLCNFDENKADTLTVGHNNCMCMHAHFKMCVRVLH